eukprot:TRINITY_DN5666_c0_g1_i1.p1 TRINITY_DN5666_c0_g1~~TRINITY_DN5666_c0_g1_i1.p1  ORF type:complete len:199 (-),score=15.93 TRINITY_DN5666_c0_g1_i1:139-735(-)
MEPHKNLKVIVIGDSGVGKTLLVQREIYKNGGMRINGIRGLDCHTIEVIHDGCVYQFQIWDTAGQERFANLTLPYYRASRGCLLVFSLENKESFDNLQSWLHKLEDNVDLENFVTVCVGNKSDLPRSVVEADIHSIRKNKNVTAYIETSALKNDQVHEAFQLLFDAVLNKLPTSPVEPSPNPRPLPPPLPPTESCCGE